MKNIIITALVLVAETSLAQTITIQPGQCVFVGRKEVCAAGAQAPTISQPYYPGQSQQAIIVDQRHVETSAYAFCSLTEHKSPNTWELYKSVTVGYQTRKHRIKSFPHFEASKCQAEADAINNQ